MRRSCFCCCCCWRRRRETKREGFFSFFCEFLLRRMEKPGARQRDIVPSTATSRASGCRRRLLPLAARSTGRLPARRKEEQATRGAKGKQTLVPSRNHFSFACPPLSIRFFVRFQLLFTPLQTNHSPARPGSAARARRWPRRSLSQRRAEPAAGARRGPRGRREGGGRCLTMSLMMTPPTRTRTTRRSSTPSLRLVAAPARAPARPSCTGLSRA